MFGFRNKRAKATDEAVLYLRSMFAGLLEIEDEGLPDRVFSDPYVAGFLQVLTTHAVANVYRWRMPETTTINEILEEGLTRLRGHGATARRTLEQSSAPTHVLHAQYLDGRRDGSEHVRTLFTSDGIARNAPHQSFRSYVKRHYL